jgi:hypothetical protein
LWTSVWAAARLLKRSMKAIRSIVVRSKDNRKGST